MKKKINSAISLAIVLFVGLSIPAVAATFDLTVYQAQKKLQELGYNPGPLDGIWGKKTEISVKQFQRDNGLTVIGRLDEETKKRLGLKTIPQAKSHLRPLVTFRMKSIPLLSIFPREKAVPKGDRVFVIVGLGDITPETQIIPSHINLLLVDKKKNNFKPIAFGLPLTGYKSPLTMVGQLISGDLKIEGPKSTFVGLIYVVPKDSKDLKLKLPDGKTLGLKIDSYYSPPEEKRISDFLSSGKIVHKLAGDTWRSE